MLGELFQYFINRYFSYALGLMPFLLELSGFLFVCH